LGADLNSVQIEEQGAGVRKTVVKTSALQYLVETGELDCVILLINNGARLDDYPINGEGSLIYRATVNSKPDILRYLLIDKKMPIPDYCVIQAQETSHERKVTLREIMTMRNFVLDKHQLAVQAEIFSFLKEHGK
jgi:hypothetical protein